MTHTKNKINVREMKTNNSKITNSLIHNYRVRSNLNNVNYSQTKNNYNSSSLYETRTKMRLLKEEHKTLYKINNNQNLREDRVNTFKEIIITFPSRFQSELTSGKITKFQLLECIDIFKEKFETETQLKIITTSLHLDEKTPHFHLISTNFLPNGRIFKKKNYYQYLQNLGGFSFKSMGLERGTPKKYTKNIHKRSSKHYEDILNEGDRLEAIMKEGLTIDNISKVIEGSVLPYKTLLTYIKRGMKKEANANYIIQQNNRAFLKFKKLFSAMPQVKNFNEMIDYIEKNPRVFGLGKGKIK